MNAAEDLKFLIRAKYGSVRKFAEVIGLSENTVNNHLKDGNWDRDQMIRVIRALNIPPRMIYVYFFESELTKSQT